MQKDEKHAEGTRGGAPAGQRSESAQAPSGGQSDAKTPSLLPSITLPKGGGAIRSIGEKFSTNPVTGTGSLSIPIAASPGRAGFELGLALQYDSGAGNGPFGIGWNLSTPSITRKTDKGLPRYDDATDSDTFLLSGAEDLVPVRVGDGAEARLDIVNRGDHRVQRYRPRTEGLFARIERWTHRSTGDVHWRVTTRDNVLSIYGRSPAARIADPDHPERVFSWLLEDTRDDRGNIVQYTYKPEDAAGVATSRTSESNRFETQADGSRVLRATAQRYLKRIQYGNRVPVLDREAPAPGGDGNYLFEVVFDYGEHDEATPTPAEVKPWAVRQDAFSSYRASFEVRTYRLCRRVLMFHRFAELGPTPCLVRSTDFSYDEGPAVTYLQAATQAGYKRNDESGTYLRAMLPPLELGYVRPVIHDELRTIDRDSLEGIRGGVAGTGAQWVDLDGEGIPGVLIPAERAWFYKANLGGGHLAPPALLRSLPSPGELGGGVQQLTDIDGNGRLELVQYAPPLSGYFERTPEGGWAPFMALPNLPNIDWNDPNLRFIDLDGDGFPDVLITEDHTFVWYRSRARKGFEPAVILSKAKDELKGPAVIFADGSETIQLADMSGDGLVDIARVRKGEVCYWPNLGHGRFGRKVTLELRAPFDASDQFDPKRIRFADIDGSGTTDILYLGRDCVRLYFNQAGNGLSVPVTLESLPPVDSLSNLNVVDLLGQGTACLVWSSPVPASQNRPLAYVDLLGGKKPHVLEKVVNNLGAETRMQYAPSTRFYLADKAAGKPWVTRLSFPVHVVERVETYDHISRNRFVTRYAYHHGYFDGVEREFRGFGMVEQWDTEELGALSPDGNLPAASNIDAASHVPPVLTRTWFHTGAFLENRRIAQQFAAEYYREPGLSDAQFEAQLLPDTTLDPAWSFEEMREACRALRGSILRQEIYALDGSAASVHPYSVSERSYAVMRLQQRVGEPHAVLFVHPREAINYHYDREPADPRVQHELTLEVDSFGNVLKSGAIGYGRRRPDPELPARDQAEQARTLITYSENVFTDSVDKDSAYRTPQPCESRSYEITGLSLPAGHDRFASGLILGAGLAAAPIEYEQAPTPGLLQKRLIERVRTVYRRDDLSGPLALGELESRALPYESYKLAFTPGLIALVYGDRVTESMLENDGHYVHSEGDAGWWIPSGQVFYSPDPSNTPAQELNEARKHFFLPRRLKDPFGHSTVVRYDPYDVLVQETRDPIGNCITAGARDAVGSLIENGNDYRVLQPRLIMDPNRNRAAVAFDALGMVVGTAIMGKPEENLGDSLAGFEPDLPAEVIAAHLSNPLADPHGILQRATTRLVYDLFAYQRTQGTPDPQPAVVYMLARETHDADLLPGQTTKVQHGLSYSDGFGREIQKKIQAEPGLLAPGGPELSPRWVGSGWTIFNNKGRPVRQYEPFFTGTHRFEFDVRIGVSPVIFYDPVDRVVATLHPNHTWEKVVFNPWRQETWDVNDTVLVADPQTDPDVADFFRRLPAADYLPTWYVQRQGGALGMQEQAAARKTAIHAATPTVAHADSLGRTFLTVAHNRFKYSNTPLAEPPVEEFYRTLVIFDIEGNQREVIDAKDRVIMRYDYDMLGNCVHQASMEAGERWTLNDVAGKPLYAWNSRNHRFRIAYDPLRRPTDSFLREGESAELLVGRSVYGETQPNPEINNFRRQVIQVFDQAGVVASDAYDFKGNLLRSQRQLAVEYKATLDWSSTTPLEADIYISSTRYDALNRPIELTSPDNSIIRPGYNKASLLERVDARLRGATFNGQPVWTLFVTNIDYDAKGQRQRIDYGNGASTFYTYDPLTLRLVHLLTRRNAVAFPDDCPQPPTAGWPGCQVQNLHYTFDPVGNITYLRDDAQQAVYFRNRRIEPSADYTYDAVYRLIEARGREHLGQIGGVPIPHSHHDAPRVGIDWSANDGNAMGTYIERYVYDVVGNILKMQHRGSDPAHSGWTRAYTYGETSLIEDGTGGTVFKTSNRLSSNAVGNGGPITEHYVYDTHGNMIRMPHLGGAHPGPNMHWNYRDQLRQADLGGGGTAYYTYDAAGQRVRKVWEKSANLIEERIYLGGFEIYRRRQGVERLERGTLHIMADEQLIALVEARTRDTAGDDFAPEQLIRYQFGNHLGSANLELNDQAQVISYEEYVPYGSTSYQAVRSQTETPKRYRYTGKERDEESGLYYHGARHYAPWLGRWTNPDPHLSKFLPWSSFAYAIDNPLRVVDPNGKDVVVIFRGGISGDETAVERDQAGTAGELDRSLHEIAEQNGIELHSIIIEPAVTSGGSVRTALEFIEQNLGEGERLIIYGYSRGGDTAVDLAQALQARDTRVDLLFTVDAAYGPLSTTFVSPVDRVIPGNVDVNINYYQTEASGPSGLTRTGEESGSDSSEEGGSSRSDSGTSDLIGSRGAPNEPAAARTRVYNREITGVEHSEIDEAVQERVVRQARDFLRSGERGSRWRPSESPGELYVREPGIFERMEHSVERFLYDLEREIIWRVAPDAFQLLYR